MSEGGKQEVKSTGANLRVAHVLLISSQDKDT